MNAIEAATAVLEGRALWRCTRAADLAAFQFGKRIRTVTFRGSEAEVGEYALHVQCPWRFVQGSRIIVGSGDLFYPEGYDQGESGAGFNYENQPNRRDSLIVGLFARRKHYAVTAVKAQRGFGLVVELEDNLYLEIFPDDSTPNEHWRLLQPANETRHLVVTGIGVDDLLNGR